MKTSVRSDELDYPALSMRWNGLRRCIVAVVLCAVGVSIRPSLCMGDKTGRAQSSVKDAVDGGSTDSIDDQRVFSILHDTTMSEIIAKDANIDELVGAKNSSSGK